LPGLHFPQATITARKDTMNDNDQEQQGRDRRPAHPPRACAGAARASGTYQIAMEVFTKGSTEN